MAGSVSSVANDIAKVIGEFVASEFRRTNRPVSGARLATKIRSEFPDFPYGQHWLAPLVNLAEREGVVVRNRQVKHLELIPSKEDNSLTVAEVPSRLAIPKQREASSQHRVHPDLWRAFLFISTSEPSYFNRDDGRVVPSYLVSVPPRANLIPIPAIPADVQQNWTKEFLQSVPSLPIEDAPTDESDWWLKFPQWLRSKGEGLDVAWRSFRAYRVLVKIREWIKQHGIPEDLVFQSKKICSAPAATSSPCQSPPDAEASIRTALVAAIAEMSLDELKEIAIPVRHILRHFIPR